MPQATAITIRRPWAIIFPTIEAAHIGAKYTIAVSAEIPPRQISDVSLLEKYLVPLSMP